MKKIIKAFILSGTILLMVFCCTKETSEWSNFVEGYVTGAFKFYKDSIKSQLTPMGYCILLERNKDRHHPYPLNFYTFDLPYEIVKYPANIQSIYYSKDCGPVFFPDTLQFKIKVRFQYKYLSEENKTRFYSGFFTQMGPTFPWENYKEVVLKDVIKIENNK